MTKEGFCYTFNNDACASCGGACCIGESGYIWLNKAEIVAIAKYLNLTLEEFGQKYLRRVKNRYSLQEVKTKNDGYACIFFDIKSRLCQIYPVRPKQCKTFPFWEQFKNDFESIKNECPGVVANEKDSDSFNS